MRDAIIIIVVLLILLLLISVFGGSIRYTPYMEPFSSSSSPADDDDENEVGSNSSPHSEMFSDTQINDNGIEDKDKDSKASDASVEPFQSNQSFAQF